MMMPATTILIGDDHPLVRAALEGALTQVLPGLTVFSAGSLDEVEHVLKSRHESIDLVLLDLNMPGSVGFCGLFLLQHQYPALPVAIISAEQDSVTVNRALHFGASDYVPKSLELKDMASAIVEILSGRVWSPYPLDRSEGASEDIVIAQRFASLTPQQLRVLAYMVEGRLNKQIAGDLNIAEQTVKTHVSAILRKLCVNTRTQAAIIAERLTRRESQQELAKPS